MKFLESIVNWCLKTEKVEVKEEKVYISCSDYFLHAKTQPSKDSVEEFLSEILCAE